MFYLRYLCLFGSSLPPVVCRRVHVLFTFCLVCLYLQLYYVYLRYFWFVFYLQLFVGGLMSYLRYMCLFGLSLPPVVCRRAYVLYTLFVFVWFVFTSSCL